MQVKFSDVCIPLHVRPNGKEVAFDQIARNLANSSFVAGILALVACLRQANGLLPIVHFDVGWH
jgi:hypothetical protein